jgi:hypothetical protein
MFIWDMFLMFLSFMWPPNLIDFARHWKEPTHGTGLGPGFYKLFLPIFWLLWFFALCADVAIVIVLVILLSRTSITFE